MERLHAPKSEALRALFWRDEILQVTFWLQGEGLGETVDPHLLERFLGVDAHVGVRYLDKLAAEGLLESRGDGTFALTQQGREHAGRVFAAEFADLTQPGHGECGADCWCHASPEEAEACVEARVGHTHDDDHHDH